MSEQMQDSLGKIYKLKNILVAVVTATLGLLLLFIAKAAESADSIRWLTNLPVFELGSTLFITGTLVITWNYVDGRDREIREDARVRRLLRESAPEFRDAVVRGFALQPEDLKRVATPELLDQIAKNVLTLRLGDKAFAEEIYEDVRDQSIRAPERWHDVEVNIRLSTAVDRSTAGTPVFDVLVEWEYTTVPSHAVRRFACVSDRDEYDDLATETPATSTWLMPVRPGLDAGNQEHFELLYFSVDGEQRTIRRSARRSGQTYSVSIGEDVVRARQPVRIKHLYRSRITQAGHYLFVELPQPTRDLSLRVDYTDTDISRLTVMDLVTSSRRPEVMQMPEQVDARVVSVDLRGWLLPRAGFTFVWTLSAEAATSDAAETRAA